MTMVTISDNDPRSIKAVEIAAGAAQWLKCRDRAGHELFGVPSSTGSGRYYLVNADGCDCSDFERHRGLLCKHVMAVRLHLALTRGAKRVKPLPSSRDGLECILGTRPPLYERLERYISAFESRQ